ncbi:MAG: hypothetical protein ACRC14_02650 [Paracoccaceae bacterium]
MTDETDIAILKVELKALTVRVDDMEERYDGHIRNVIKAIVLGALLVLWKPFSDFWQALNK